MKKQHNQAGRPRGTGWRLSGNEPYACRVAHPRDLPGIHAGAIAAGLAPGEPLRYLLYSPIWEGNRAPFGITAEPASHALAVTHDRFLISRDPHRQGAAPALLTIPFADVLYVQLGSSFCLGWFAVSFAGQARAAYESVLFRAVRRDRFAAAIRQYRSNAAQSRPWNPAQPGPGWEKVWGQDRSQAERIGELLVPNEHPIGALHTSEQWAEQRSFWKRKWSCSSREGLLLATDMGVFQVARETYDRPVTWNIGMNVVYAPLQAVRSATIFGRALFGKRLHHVQVTLGIRDVTTCLEVPFDDNDIDAAKDLVQDLTARGSSWSQNQVHAESMNLTPSAQESRS